MLQQTDGNEGGLWKSFAYLYHDIEESETSISVEKSIERCGITKSANFKHIACVPNYNRVKP